MPYLEKGEINNYVTKCGKKVIALHISERLEKRIVERAQSQDLTRQAYIITLINADLAKAEKESRENAYLPTLQENVQAGR